MLSLAVMTAAAGCAGREPAPRPEAPRAADPQPRAQAEPPSRAPPASISPSTSPSISPDVDMRPRSMSNEGHPTPVDGHTAVWTGKVVVFWGGDEAFPVESNGYAPVQPRPHADGRHYDPVSDRWSPMPEAPIDARFDHIAVWTGSEMLVWGGRDATRTLGDGAAYDPVAGSWRRISSRGAPKPRTRPGVAWTGNELLVVGGQTVDGGGVAGAHAYDPAKDRWRALPALEARAPAGVVWTGREAIVWGGAAAGDAAGLRLDPSRGWTALPTDGAPPVRAGSIVASVGGAMVVWGGRHGDDEPVATGARFDPTASAWSPLSEVGAVAREFPEFVVLGDVVAILGEPVDWEHNDHSLSLYNAAEDRWWTIPGPYASAGIAMAWTGTDLVAWGGHDGTNMSPTGECVRLR
ncbi:MAG: hypothetical protein AAF721_19550 [Myxococcota bacterium]